MTFNLFDPLELDNSACKAVFFLLFAEGNKAEVEHVHKGYVLDMKFQNFIGFALCVKNIALFSWHAIYQLHCR